MRLVVLLTLAVLACAGPEGPSSGEPAGAEARPAAGIPVGRSQYTRPGRFSYRLFQVDPAADNVLNVDMELSHGSRVFQHIEVRVIVYGSDGEIRTQDLALGPLGRGRQEPRRRFRARVPDVTFPVEDVGLELLLAVQ